MEVDISGIWGQLSLPDLLGLEKAVFYAHRDVAAAPNEYGFTDRELKNGLDLYSYENPAWLYTAARKLLADLGKREQVAFWGPGAERYARNCPLLPGTGGDAGDFLTLIGAGVTMEALADRAETIAREDRPLILLNPDTPEQLNLLLRFSAALWEKLN